MDLCLENTLARHVSLVSTSTHRYVQQRTREPLPSVALGSWWRLQKKRGKRP